MKLEVSALWHVPPDFRIFIHCNFNKWLRLETDNVFYARKHNNQRLGLGYVLQVVSIDHLGQILILKNATCPLEIKKEKGKMTKLLLVVGVRFIIHGKEESLRLYKTEMY